MKTAATFTTNLSTDLLQWLSEFAQESSQTKRNILEKALQRFRDDMIRAKMKSSFQKAAKDPEVAELAEAGLDDYLQQLQSLTS